MQVEVDVEMMARCRETRRKRQKKLLEEFELPCISFSLNIPGAVKDSPLYRRIHTAGLAALETQFHSAIVYINTYHSVTGPESYLVIQDSAVHVKNTTVEIEDSHPLGRIFDMDVIDTEGLSISRRDFGLHPRRCLICDEPAAVCARSRKHSINELLQKIGSIARDI